MDPVPQGEPLAAPRARGGTVSPPAPRPAEATDAGPPTTGAGTTPGAGDAFAGSDDVEVVDAFAALGASQPPEDPPSLEAIDRRRRRLWLITGLFLLVATGVVALTLANRAGTEATAAIPGFRWGLLALAAAFLLYAFDQERLLRRFTRAFVAHDVRAATLETRVEDLTTLTRTTRRVNAARTVDEVAEAVLDASAELIGVHDGCVWRIADEELLVVAGRGTGTAAVDARRILGDGPAGEAALRQRTLLVRRSAASAHDPDAGAGTVLAVPLVADERILGVLTLERPGDETFTEIDLRSIALFADHAGVAIASAQRYERERDTASRLAEVLELRSEYLAALVHDMKSPITAILGYTNLLSLRWTRLEDEHRSRAFDAMSQEGQRLLQMVEGVLHSASVDAGAPLRPRPVGIAALVRPLLESVAASAHGREGVHREIRCAVRPEGTAAMVSGDEQALHHVFLNLLDNAVKYSPPGTPVDVSIAAGTGQIVVEVTDYGAGIAVEDQSHVFERFRRVAGEGGGVGLGLYIARTLVTAHGGWLSVSSVEGEGSTFRVVLPAEDS